jgi:hypothetical protein
LLATNNITAGSGLANVGWFQNADIEVQGTLDIEANSSSTSGSACGVLISPATITVTGPLFIIGSCTGSSNSLSSGVMLNGANISSAAASISGSTNATIAGSHGVDIPEATSITAGTISFIDCTAGLASSCHAVNIASPLTITGNAHFQNCTSGSTNSAAINVAAMTAISGNLSATSSITTTTGSGNVGWRQNATMTIGGAVNITASSISTSGSSFGVLFANGLLSAAGTVSINGSAIGSSDTASSGVKFTGGLIDATTTFPITISGSSNSTEPGSHGVFLPDSLLSITTTGTATFSGTAVNEIPDSFPVFAPSSIETAGPLSFTSAVGIGEEMGSSTSISSSGNMQFSSTINGIEEALNHLTLTATSATITFGNNLGTTQTLGTLTISTGSAAVVFGPSVTQINVSELDVQEVPAVISHVGTTLFNSTNGSISFGSSLLPATNTAQSLTFSADNGNILFAGNIGTNSLAFSSFVIDNTGTVFFAETVEGVHAATFIQNNTIPFVFQGEGHTTIDTSSVGGNIIFRGTIDGETDIAERHSLTLNSGGGNTVLQSDIGSSVELGTFTIADANFASFSLSSITASSLRIEDGISTTIAHVGTTTIQTSEEGGIYFGGLLRGLTGGNQSLSLDAGGVGKVNFQGNIGSNRLGAISIANATAVGFGPSLDSVNANSFVINGAIPATFNFSGIITFITTAAEGISFGGAINGALANDQALSFSATNAGPIDFSGNIGNDTALGNISIASATGVSLGTDTEEIRASSFIIGSNIPATLNVSGTTNIITTGALGVSFGSTVAGVVANAQNLEISATNGPVVFTNIVGSNDTPLGNFVVSQGTGLTFGNSATEIDVNTINVAASIPIVLTGSGTTTITTYDNAAGNMFFGGTINGSAPSNHSLILSPSGTASITFAGAIGNNNPLDAIIIIDANTVLANGSINAITLTQSNGTGSTTFSGTVTLSGDADLTGNSFDILAPIIANNVSIDNAGMLAINSDGDMNLAGSFAQIGAGGVAIGGDITVANDIAFASQILLSSSVSMSAGSTATFSSTINGNHPFSVSANDIVFEGIIGNALSPTSLVAIATNTIYVQGNHTVASGPMVYSGDLLLGTSTIFTNTGGNSTSFTSISGPHNCTISANNTTVHVSGDIDLSGDGNSFINGGNLSISGGFGATVVGTINTQGSTGDSNGGFVTIQSNHGSLDVNTIITSGTNNGSGGNITLTPSSEYSGDYPTGIVTLRGNLTSLPTPDAGGNIVIDAERLAPPKVATIVSSQDGNSITIAGKSFSVGQNEAMTVFGDLTITCATSVTLSDIIVTESLFIAAPSIFVNERASIEILDHFGQLYPSPSVHYFSGESNNVFGTIIPPDAVRIASLELVPEEFVTLLSFDGHMLDYDTNLPPPPTPSPGIENLRLAQSLIYKLTVADTQLSDHLPIYRYRPVKYQQKRKTK